MKVGTAAPLVLLARTELAVAVEPKAVTLEPELVTAPLMFAFVVTFAAVPPMLSVLVAAYASAVPSSFEYNRLSPVKEVTPVPPRRTVSVPLVSERATLREEVATQEGRPVVYELVRKEPVEVARVVRAAVPVGVPKRRLPSATEVRPVPPVVTATVPVTLPALPVMLAFMEVVLIW